MKFANKVHHNNASLFFSPHRLRRVLRSALLNDTGEGDWLLLVRWTTPLQHCCCSRHTEIEAGCCLHVGVFVCLISFFFLHFCFVCLLLLRTRVSTPPFFFLRLLTTHKVCVATSSAYEQSLHCRRCCRLAVFLFFLFLLFLLATMMRLFLFFVFVCV